jgi:hypothetical protein
MFNDRLTIKIAPLEPFEPPPTKIPFLKWIIFSYLILAAFNLNCVNVISVWMPNHLLSFTYITIFFFSSICKAHNLSLLHHCISPYTWFHNNVIKTFMWDTQCGNISHFGFPRPTIWLSRSITITLCVLSTCFWNSTLVTSIVMMV